MNLARMSDSHDLAVSLVCYPRWMLSSPIEPPNAKRIPQSSEIWGDTRQDDYGWMTDKSSPAVLDHLRSENRYTEAVLEPLSETIEDIYSEIRGRIKETDLSVPIEEDGWLYYSRSVEGYSYGIHCRQPVIPGQPALTETAEPNGGPEQILLDENIEADGHDFFELGVFDVSPDNNLLLWGKDTTGDEKYSLQVRSIETGEVLDESLAGVSAGSTWALDNKSFCYVRQDETNRPYQVWLHRVGENPSEDVLLFEEPDQRFFVGVGRDKDDSFIYIGSSSRITDEVRVIPAAEPLTEPRVLLERTEGVEYSVCHYKNEFVLVTNLDAPSFRVVTMPDSSSGLEEWKTIVAHDPDVTIRDADVLSDFLVLFERAEGITRIRTRRWTDGSISTVKQPEPVSTVWPGANVDPDSSVLRYGYTSMVTPSSVLEVDLNSGERRLLKQQEVVGGYDSSQYETRRLWAQAEDGVEVPLSVVWKKDRPTQGPGVLYGYGAYEASIDPGFSVARLSLLDRGFVFAIAHVRGGGELGRQWHLDGKYEKKVTTFSDAVACAKKLIEDEWTTPDKLAIRGGSAGGLLVGAVLNQAPELFGAAVAEVPFVDTLSTMLDASLPLTVTEWEEWGNPADSEEIYRAMRAYSPVDNVSERPYPTVYATAGLNDTRVSYWEPAKWVQLVRRTSTIANPVLLWTDMDAGHQGPSGRYEVWRQEARTLGFIVGAVSGPKEKS